MKTSALSIRPPAAPMRVFLFGVLSFLFAAGPAALAQSGTAAPVTSGVVDASLRQGGAAHTLDRFFPCDADPRGAYAQVASGSRPWIDLAVELLGTADACRAESLQEALGAAMQVAPAKVLPYVDRTPATSAGRICLPFVSDEQPLDAQAAALVASRSAIAQVTTRRLAKQRAACLSVIDQAIERLRSR